MDLSLCLVGDRCKYTPVCDKLKILQETSWECYLWYIIHVTLDVLS